MLLEKCFTGIEKMDFAAFSSVVEKISSDMFLFVKDFLISQILIFLLKKKPFSNKTLEEFSNGKTASNNLKVNYGSGSNNTNRLIASPNLQSKFSPSVTISKSPSMTKRMSSAVENDSKNLLNKFALNSKGPDSKAVLSKYAGGSSTAVKEEETKDVDEGVGSRNIPVNRKNRNNLKNIEELPKNNLQITVTSKTQYNDLPITGAVKQTKKTSVDVKLDDPEMQKK